MRLVRTRLELAEAKGAAYLPAPAMDRCLYAGVYTRAGVKEVLTAAAKATMNPVVGEYAITHLEDQKLLADIAQTAVDKEVRHSAVCRLGEPRWLAEPAIQSLLLEVAKTASDQTRRQEAARRLSDPALLADAEIQALLVEAVYDRLIPVATHTPRWSEGSATRRLWRRSPAAQETSPTPCG